MFDKLIEYKILGFPVFIYLLILSIIIPVIAVNILLFAANKKQERKLESEIINTRIVFITPNPTATPSATIIPTPTTIRSLLRTATPAVRLK